MIRNPKDLPPTRWYIAQSLAQRPLNFAWPSLNVLSRRHGTFRHAELTDVGALRVRIGL